MSEHTGSDEPEDVLLVEDNPGDVRLVEESFEAAESDVTLHVASDGVEALEFLYRRGDHADAPRPALVLLDLNLPRKDGDEVLAEMSEDPVLGRTPVVVLTSSDAREDVVRSYDLHANAYVPKPVDPDAFIETVRSFETFWLDVVRLPPLDDAE